MGGGTQDEVSNFVGNRVGQNLVGLQSLAVRPRHVGGPGVHNASVSGRPGTNQSESERADGQELRTLMEQAYPERVGSIAARRSGRQDLEVQLTTDPSYVEVGLAKDPGGFFDGLPQFGLGEAHSVVEAEGDFDVLRGRVGGYCLCSGEQTHVGREGKRAHVLVPLGDGLRLRSPGLCWSQRWMAASEMSCRCSGFHEVAWNGR